MIPLEQNELTMAEKREFIERMTELIDNNIINQDDRKSIYFVCMAACARELVKMMKEE